MKVASVRFSATKEQLHQAMQQDNDDRAAVLFFLLGAERDGVMLQGRLAVDVVAAAARLLRVSDEALQAIRESLA